MRTTGKSDEIPPLPCASATSFHVSAEVISIPSKSVYLPFGSKLDPSKRSVKLANPVQRRVAEELYIKKFPSEHGAGGLVHRTKVTFFGSEYSQSDQKASVFRFVIATESYRAEALSGGSRQYWRKNSIRHETPDQRRRRMEHYRAAVEKPVQRRLCSETGCRSEPEALRPLLRITHADKINWKRAELKERKERGIRNLVEGKSGQPKQRYEPGRVRVRLAKISKMVVSITSLDMNMDRVHGACIMQPARTALAESEPHDNTVSDQKALIGCREKPCRKKFCKN